MSSVLVNNKKFKSLKLGIFIYEVAGNLIGDKSATMIGKCLNNPDLELEVLDLGQNKIGDVGMREIAASLVDNTKLCYLDLCIIVLFLAWNDFGIEGAGQLGLAIKDNSSLKTLNICIYYHFM